MLKYYKGHWPKVSPSAYVAKSAELIGRVKLAENVSIWPNSVLRGDVEEIVVGENSNIQDGSVIHTNYGLPVIIGKDVTVGHGAILHGCEIGDLCLIGMGAVLLDGCEVGEYTVIAAGALVPEGKKLEPESVYMGVPAKKARNITPNERELIKKRAEEYIEFAKEYKSFNGLRYILSLFRKG